MHIHCDNKSSVLIQITKDYYATKQQERELQKKIPKQTRRFFSGRA